MLFYVMLLYFLEMLLGLISSFEKSKNFVYSTNWFKNKSQYHNLIPYCWDAMGIIDVTYVIWVVFTSQVAKTFLKYLIWIVIEWFIQEDF